MHSNYERQFEVRTNANITYAYICMYAHLIRQPISGLYSSLLRPVGCLWEKTRHLQGRSWWPKRTATKTSVLVSDRHCVVYVPPPSPQKKEYEFHVFLLYFCVNLLSNPDSTNYLHIAGQSSSNAADYINATMIAVSGHTHTQSWSCTSTHIHTHLHICPLHLAIL